MRFIFSWETTKHTTHHLHHSVLINHHHLSLHFVGTILCDRFNQREVCPLGLDVMVVPSMYSVWRYCHVSAAFVFAFMRPQYVLDIEILQEVDTFSISEEEGLILCGNLIRVGRDTFHKSIHDEAGVGGLQVLRKKLTSS
jgi:hypothetical protein